MSRTANGKRWSIGVIAAAVLCLAASACKRSHKHATAPSASASASASTALPSPPVPTATDSAPVQEPKNDAQLHHVGDTATLPDYHIKVVDVRECKQRTYYHPRAGNVWLGVEVSIEATTEREVRTSPFFAHLVDGAGRHHTATFNGCKPTLKVSRLTKGDHVRGYITFEVPGNANGLRFEYDPFIIGGMKQPVAFVIVR